MPPKSSNPPPSPEFLEAAPIAVGLPAEGVLNLSTLDATFLNVAAARVKSSGAALPTFEDAALSIVFRSGADEATSVAQSFASAVAVIVYITPTDRFVSLIVPEAPTVMLWEAGEISEEDARRWDGVEHVCLLSVAVEEQTNNGSVTTDGVRYLSVLPVIRAEDAVLGDFGDLDAEASEQGGGPESAAPELLQAPRPAQTEALSESLLRFTEPVLPPEAYEDPEAALAVVRLCAAIWNSTLLGPDDTRNPELPALPDSPLVEGLVARKHAHFGDDRRVIGDVDMVEDGDGAVLRVGEADDNPWLA